VHCSAVGWLLLVAQDCMRGMLYVVHNLATCTIINCTAQRVRVTETAADSGFISICQGYTSAGNGKVEGGSRLGWLPTYLLQLLCKTPLACAGAIQVYEERQALSWQACEGDTQQVMQEGQATTVFVLLDPWKASISLRRTCPLLQTLNKR
jgi:hypothetical protein